jgi:hypothetical protein
MELRFVLLIVFSFFVIHHLYIIQEDENYMPHYPSDENVHEFVRQQLALIRQHNKYELENGFVSHDRFAKRTCKLITNPETLRKMWIDNVIIQHYYTNKKWNKLFDEYCMDHPYLTPLACHYILTYNQWGNGQYPFDSLFVTSKYYNDIIAPREKPQIKIMNIYHPKINKNDTTDVPIKVALSLPNGTRIGMKDDRIKLAFDSFYGCQFSIISDSELLLQYKNDSGSRSCDYEYFGRHNDTCDTDPYLCEKVLVCSERLCSFSFGWNYSNPIVNAPNTSLWLVRHDYFNSEFLLNYTDINIEELARRVETGWHTTF